MYLPSSLLKKSQKLRDSGARAGKADLAGNVGYLAKRSNTASACARVSRRARPTGPVDFVALLDKVIYIACGPRLATDPVGHAEQMRFFQQAASVLRSEETELDRCGYTSPHGRK